MNLSVTIIGAGSAVFARQLLTDILRIPGLGKGSFALVDINPVCSSPEMGALFDDEMWGRGGNIFGPLIDKCESFYSSYRQPVYT